MICIEYLIELKPKNIKFLKRKCEKLMLKRLIFLFYIWGGKARRSRYAEGFTTGYRIIIIGIWQSGVHTGEGRGGGLEVECIPIYILRKYHFS